MTKRDTGPQQEPEKDFEHMELSDAWRELLGKRLSAQPGTDAATPAQRRTQTDSGAVGNNEQDAQDLPTLLSDPWSTLIQSQGVEVVDLNKAHLPIDDQDVERILKLMQEYPDHGDGSASATKPPRGTDHEKS